MYNKLISKHSGAKGFMWWIKKANELDALRIPPCYSLIFLKGKWNRFKASIKHFIFCRNYPYPHRIGDKTNAIPAGYNMEELEKEFERYMKISR